MHSVQGFFYYARREGLALTGRMRGRGVLIHLALIAVFGVFLPMWKGIDFLDSVILSAYACLAILFAAPAAAEAFAASRPASFQAAMAKVAIALIYAEFMTVAILGTGLATVYSRTHFPVPPDFETLAVSAIFGFAAAAAMASIAGWLALRFSSGIARGVLRVLFLGLLLVFFYRSRWLPDVAARGAAISVGIAIAALLAIRHLASRKAG